MAFRKRKLQTSDTQGMPQTDMNAGNGQNPNLQNNPYNPDLAGGVGSAYTTQGGNAAYSNAGVNPGDPSAAGNIPNAGIPAGNASYDPNGYNPNQAYNAYMGPTEDIQYEQLDNQNAARGKQIPDLSTAELEKELARCKHSRLYQRTLKSTVYTLVIIAAFAVLVATLWLPVLQIYGTSMQPTLNEGDIVVSVKQSNFKTGDVVAFYYNNKVLIKRVIAGPGDYVDIDKEGNVTVNGTLLDEPYLEEKALGDSDIDYPYQVPDKRWFVMGDHRSISLDSRTRAIGPIAEEQIVGKLAIKIWPLF